MMTLKPIEKIELADADISPIWEFATSEMLKGDIDETWVFPVAVLPVTSMAGRIALTNLRLANGNEVPGMILGIDISSKEKTEVFVSISAFTDSGWVNLSRYFDFDYNRNGPEAFAQRLGLKTDDVFPVYYDIRKFVSVEKGVTFGYVQRDPEKLLTKDQIISLSLK